jgi:transcriptional regulator with XRE-family HTH domain
MSVGQSVYSRALLRACQILGGPDQLAVRVGVSRLMIRALMKGSVNPSQQIFLKVIDILMAADGYEQYDANRPPQRETRTSNPRGNGAL